LDFVLGLNAVQKNRAASALLSEGSFLSDAANERVRDRDVGENKSHVLLDDVAIFVEVVSGKLEFGIGLTGRTRALIWCPGCCRRF
jgi:hypothetical protein